MVWQKGGAKGSFLQRALEGAVVNALGLANYNKVKGKSKGEGPGKEHGEASAIQRATAFSSVAGRTADRPGIKPPHGQERRIATAASVHKAPRYNRHSS